jgi:hypothetical protein
MTVIGLIGRAQHGKDSVAKVLVEQHGFTRFAFADKLKAFVYAQNPFVEYHHVLTRIQTVVDSVGWEEAKAVPEVGRLLQVTGTEAAREVLGPDVWVNAVRAEAQRALFDGGVVFSDVRFPNEAATVYGLGGELWKVVRPDFDSGRDPNHPSEANVDTLPYDVLLVNEGTLLDLENGVNSAYKVSREWMV